MTAWFGGDRMILRSVRAREVQKHYSPRLWNVVEEMSIAAGVPMPRVFLVEDPAPNAFAVGRDPQHAAVAVTSGLLRMLSRDEVQGVVAHEIGHVHNLDIRFMTIAAVLVGSVELLSRTFLEVGPGHASAGRRGGGGPKGGGVPVLLLLAFAVSVLSPVLVRLLYLWPARGSANIWRMPPRRASRAIPRAWRRRLKRSMCTIPGGAPRRISMARCRPYTL